MHLWTAKPAVDARCLCISNCLNSLRLAASGIQTQLPTQIRTRPHPIYRSCALTPPATLACCRPGHTPKPDMTQSTTAKSAPPPSPGPAHPVVYRSCALAHRATRTCCSPGQTPKQCKHEQKHNDKTTTHTPLCVQVVRFGAPRNEDLLQAWSRAAPPTRSPSSTLRRMLSVGPLRRFFSGTRMGRTLSHVLHIEVGGVGWSWVAGDG